MVLPSASFMTMCDPMLPLTGHARSRTSSTVPLNTASAEGSYFGTGSLDFVSWAVPRTAAATTTPTIIMTCQIFMAATPPDSLQTIGCQLDYGSGPSRVL